MAPGPLKEAARGQVQQWEKVRHNTFFAKYEAEERYQLERLGSRFSRVKWILASVKSDLKQLLRGVVPIHLEVVGRITLSAFLSYVIALVSFPLVVPESQRVLIAMLVPMLGMLFPTLIFSIGLVMFPELIFVCLLGLVIATMLLVCATVSLGLYLAMFGITALLISGMRFNKKTGGMTCFLVIEMALNSQPLARTASELGLDFVKSLWTERGVTNPKAIYTNTLVGMMWIICVMIVGRILPPFRTARTGVVKGLLPASLKSVADSIDLNAQELQLRLDAKGSTQSSNSDEHNGSDDLKTRRHQLKAKLIHEKSVLTNGKIAGLTAFEPRLCRFSPPECSWMALKTLCSAVDRTVLASLSLGKAWSDPQEMSVDLEQQLISGHEKAAASLRSCAKAIMHNTRVQEENDSKDVNEIGHGSSEECDQEDLDCLAVDPVVFESVCRDVVVATNEWAAIAGPPDRTKPFFDKNARTAIKLNTVPWLKGSCWYLIGLLKQWRTALRRSTWQGIFQPPYLNADKASWCLDFTVGFTALVAMGVYWEAFINLDNESWILIAYAFSTTQTAEGTAKKGILRLIGTAAGGLSGWLAITACGKDGIYGLIAWLTVFTAVTAYVGLPRGFKARLGLSPDYGYGPAYFVMTQALVVAQVYLGIGDKRTITVNRISTNIIGIAMAIVLALIPPALYGGNPKFARNIMEEERSLLVECLQLLLSETDESNSDDATIEAEIEKIRSDRVTKITALLDEANDFYEDSSKLHSFHLLKVDPELKKSLDMLQVVASWIFLGVGYGVQTLKSNDQFLQDKEHRDKLQEILEELKTGGSVENEVFEKLTVQDEEDGGTSPATKSIIFINCIILAMRELQEVDDELKRIKYGLFS